MAMAPFLFWFGVLASGLMLSVVVLNDLFDGIVWILNRINNKKRN